MTDTPTNHELAQRVTRLEERMETVKAELKGALAEFRADMVKMELRIYLGIGGMLLAGGFLLLRFLAAGT